MQQIKQEIRQIILAIAKQKNVLPGLCKISDEVMSEYVRLLKSYYSGTHVDVGWLGLIEHKMRTLKTNETIAHILASERDNPLIKKFFQ